MHMHNYANHPAERLRNRVAHGRIKKYSRPKVAQRVVPPLAQQHHLHALAPQGFCTAAPLSILGFASECT
jgi:hypothetical protein